MRDVFKEKCRLGYQRILERRSDIRIRFGVLLDAGITELRQSDIQYLDRKLGFNDKFGSRGVEGRF